MDKERLAFLDRIEADMTTRKPSRPVEATARPVEPAGPSRLFRRIGMFGVTLAAAVSFSALHANAASAVPYCGVPNPVAYSHTKSCGVGFYYHDYIYQYGAGPGGQKTCYVFWSHLSDLGCGADPGHETYICA
jgi:hypothetical protein